jgi:hypothetical protein
VATLRPNDFGTYDDGTARHTQTSICASLLLVSVSCCPIARAKSFSGRDTIDRTARQGTETSKESRRESVSQSTFVFFIVLVSEKSCAFRMPVVYDTDTFFTPNRESGWLDQH